MNEIQKFTLDDLKGYYDNMLNYLKMSRFYKNMMEKINKFCFLILYSKQCIVFFNNLFKRF